MKDFFYFVRNRTMAVHTVFKHTRPISRLSYFIEIHQDGKEELSPSVFVRRYQEISLNCISENSNYSIIQIR